MLTSEHETWKVANAVGELDELIPHIEDLIEKWSSQANNEVKFTSASEITIATYLLKDDLLPYAARIALAEALLSAMNEADKKKYSLKSLFIGPGRPGRKEEVSIKHIRIREVFQLIKQGKTATEAYKAVAEKHFKSTDTIRRDYERFLDKYPKHKSNGKIEK